MKQNKRNFTVALTATFLASTALVGCSSDSKTDASQATSAALDATQEISLPLNDEIPTLDISKAIDSIAFTVLSNVNEGLTRLDANNKAQGAIAEKWDVSQDGKTYTFHLRDTKWSNGDPVTAKDFEYSWKRTLNPETKSEYAFLMNNWIKGAEEYNQSKGGKGEEVGVKALDDKTLQVTLNQPVPFFAELMAFPLFFPQEQKFVEAQGDKYAGDADKLLFNGPFKMTAWNHEQSVELEKNDSYWDKGKVKLNKVHFQVVKDTGTASNLYESGQLDRTPALSGSFVDTYKNNPDFSTVPQLTSGYLSFNYDRKFLQSAKVRQALTFAVDGEMYANLVYNDGSKGATGLVPSGIQNADGGDYRQTAGDLIKRKDNLAKAKQLLADGMKEEGITSMPTIKILVDAGDVGQKGAEFLQAQWKQNLGLNAEIDPVPFKLRLQRMGQHDYDVAISRFGADYNDPATFLDNYWSGSSFKSSEWKSTDFDNLMSQAHTESDSHKRMDLLAKAETVLMQEMPVGPLFFRGQAVLTKPYVKNFQTRTYGGEYDLKETFIQGKK
ncbi:peptide ABC transporter substrate-binding protein [Tumebacillus sp. ITR2]|uniref:Peptide ABC transporter substrate-binding protein n=1 Tax=Tumebacillus amylolyticus TaxID=2801339 RepID=A0ABS1J992_9BACL|nr:peptide ABC transporter substrate-binding protein [Tumebacillus amylolyticus]MBL0386842.1 peptide ABC transporter substrate-binding protein [Tumebacillus amylolyticus]